MCMPVSQIHKESVLALLTLVVASVSNVSSDLEGQRGAIGVALSVFHARYPFAVEVLGIRINAVGITYIDRNIIEGPNFSGSRSVRRCVASVSIFIH